MPFTIVDFRRFDSAKLNVIYDNWYYANVWHMHTMWAQQIIETLIQQGLEYFCIAPGSRSTPLVCAVAENPKAQTFVHFDERGLAFHALGYAMGSGKPAVVIATSGTAVANLFPAVMEASIAHVPLIVITADRPPELRNRGANQTADQVKLFQDYVRFEVDLPCPDEDLPSGYLASTLGYAVYKARSSCGPVHINCMLREKGRTAFQKDISAHGVHYSYGPQTLTKESYALFAEKLSSIKEGAIILGKGAIPTEDALHAVYALAQGLGWPVFADILSGARSYPFESNLLPYHDFFIEDAPEVQGILHLGDRLVSGPLAQWILKSNPSPYILVAEHFFQYDPQHLITDRVICNTEIFCTEVLQHLSEEKKTFWKAEVCIPETFSEPYLMHLVQQAIPAEYALFIANSIPIRDAERFFFPNRPIGPIFANRGVSGIDGNIATAFGIAQGIKRPVLAIIGDQSCLHDLNSFAMKRHASYPVIFLIYNNKGGAIFSSLPIGKSPLCDTFFTASHPFTFEGLAHMFTIPYCVADDLTSFCLHLPEILARQSTCILEALTCREENKRTLEACELTSLQEIKS